MLFFFALLPRVKLSWSAFGDYRVDFGDEFNVGTATAATTRTINNIPGIYIYLVYIIRIIYLRQAARVSC